MHVVAAAILRWIPDLTEGCVYLKMVGGITPYIWLFHAAQFFGAADSIQHPFFFSTYFSYTKCQIDHGVHTQTNQGLSCRARDSIQVSAVFLIESFISLTG